jgi:hypothetical protein
MKHLKHLKHALATCVFHPSSEQRIAERGTAGSGQPAAKDGGTAWQQPVVPTPGMVWPLRISDVAN